MPDAPLTVGLALGSGASRGWSHIGIIEALIDAGIEPDVVCGTSVGAMVGGSYVAGNLTALKNWVLESTRSDVMRFLEIGFSQAGFVDLARMHEFLHRFVAADHVQIENLPKQYVAVCTDLNTGREVWRQQGALADAALASMAMPGLFSPVEDGDRWLVDGGLVNPVPVTACRALGADIVIGVNLNSDIVGKWLRKPEPRPEASENGVLDSIKRRLRASDDDGKVPPGLFDTITSSINIFQDRITRSRLAGDPADILISPKLSDIGILDFHRAAEAIRTGEECVRAAMDDIRRAVGAA